MKRVLAARKVTKPSFSLSRQYILPNAWSNVERVELSLRWLLGVDPAGRLELPCVVAPDSLAATRHVRAPGDPLASIDLGAIGQHVILHTDLEVSGDGGVETEG